MISTDASEKAALCLFSATFSTYRRKLRRRKEKKKRNGDLRIDYVEITLRFFVSGSLMSLFVAGSDERAKFFLGI